MITRKQYDELNEGDTVTATFNATWESYEVTSKVYLAVDGMKCLAGKNLIPDLGGDHWTITGPIIPAVPEWHSAWVISATGPDGGREIYVRDSFNEGAWVRIGDWDEVNVKSLKNVKILVGKDTEL